MNSLPAVVDRLSSFFPPASFRTQWPPQTTSIPSPNCARPPLRLGQDRLLVELCLFIRARLLDRARLPVETALFGLLHGIGYLGLCGLILWAIVRREAPWPLLAATLTPLGPVGAVIGIELIERRGWGIGARELTPRRNGE